MATGKTNLVLGMSAREAQLKKDLAKAQRHLKRFQGQSKTISAGINKSMIGMFSVFSAGIIARDIFQTVTGFEKQMDKVQAISGATAKQMDSLSESAVEIGRASKFTATEIGNLQEELARLGFTSKQIIASTDAIRKLATAADAELGESAKILASTLNAFNIEAERSDEIANVMAESFSKSALDLEKFGVAMSNVGATAKAAGFSMSDTTAMMGTLVDSGIDASKAGTDLRKIFTELSIKGMTLEEALAEIRGSTDKVKTAFDLFGQRAQVSAIVLAENTEKLGKLQGALGDSNMELNQMVGIMEDNLITDLQKLKSAWDGFILSLEDGSGVGSSALRGITKGVTDLLNGLSDWDKFTKGTDWQKIADDQQKINAVAKEFERIKIGETFDNISVETMEYAKAMETLDKRLSAFKEHQHYEDIAASVQTYKDELKKANDEQQRKIELDRKQLKSFKDLTAPSRGISNLSTVGTDGPQLAEIAPFQISNEGFERSKEMMAAKYGEINAFIQQQNEMLAATMRDSMAAGISGFAEGIATGGIEQALNNIALVFAQGISQIGDQLITYGVTMIAAKKALANPFTNPAVAIAAGIAAKVAASALKGAIASNSTKIASSGGSGSGRGSGSFQNNVQGQSIQLGGEFKISGKDLVYVFNENTRTNNRLQG